MKKLSMALAALAVVFSFALAPVHADEDSESMKTTLKEISEKQDRILAELESLKTELNIVKIRVSSR